jgi:hypothetical protein
MLTATFFICGHLLRDVRGGMNADVALWNSVAPNDVRPTVNKPQMQFARGQGPRANRRKD